MDITIPSPSPFFLALALVGVSACAIPGTSTLSRVGPPEDAVDTERVVSDEYAAVWERLTTALSSGPFVVEEARRGAGIIEASFSAVEPERYVDCGTTTRTYRRGNDRQSYTYPLAAAASYRWAMGTGSHGHLPLTYAIDRDTDLDVRLRIRLVPEDDVTRVGATARYDLSIAVTGDYVLEAANGVPIDEGPIVPQTYRVTFRTNQPNVTGLGTEDDPVWVSCVSKGLVEGQVLEMADAGG